VLAPHSLDSAAKKMTTWPVSNLFLPATTIQVFWDPNVYKEIGIKYKSSEINTNLSKQGPELNLIVPFATPNGGLPTNINN